MRLFLKYEQYTIFYIYFKGTSRLTLFQKLDKLVDLDSRL